MRVWMNARLLLLTWMVLAVAFLAGPAWAQSPPSDDTQQEQPALEAPVDAPATVPGRIIVKFEADATRAEEADARRDVGLRNVEELPLIDAEVARVEGQSVEQAVQDLERRPDVDYAEPDCLSYPAGYADEPHFGELWGLNNTGQTIGGSAGVSDVDINALEASAVTQGDPNLVVAVIDSGVDFTHPDLAGRQWVNPGESVGGKETNGVDDDQNGFVDDLNGWNFCNDTPTPFTVGDHPHGTHVAGTVAASANGAGVVGVAPNVKVMALKFGCGASGNASSENVIRALAYARMMGVRIANYSYGYLGGPSQAQKDAIENYGGLFVASAGNDSHNNDGNANFTAYPSSYDLPNILAVAAVDNRGSLGDFSNYGATTVDISAPGVDILSTLPGSSYDFWNGTSMAAPHVTGTAALVASVNSGLLDDVAAIKKVIMDTGKPLAATSGKTVTGDMVNAYAAVQNPTDTAPPR
jgi:subtilisin family serine protease